MNEAKTTRQPRMPRLIEALATMAVLIIVLAVGIMVYGVDPHVPMFVGVCAAAGMAMYLGYRWDDVEKMMMDGIYKALQSCCILIIVGILIGVWINAGVVPTMIYYGLQLLHPTIFFIATLLICSITSLATGTSWGTMGTMGVALMGIGFGLDMNPGMTAGAILSGAYFGDKMSPLSDTTNLAPAMAGTDVMTHVKAMMLPTAITYAITLVFFGVLGFMQYHGGDADMSRVTEFANALNIAHDGVFHINPLLLLPPVLVIVAVALKVPAIPGITLGIFAGAIMGLIFQPGSCNLGTIFDYGINGYSTIPQTNPEILYSRYRTERSSMMFSQKMMAIIDTENDLRYTLFYGAYPEAGMLDPMSWTRIHHSGIDVSEVWLTKAEAALRKSTPNVTEAIEALDYVRDRRYLNQNYAAAPTDPDALLT